MKIFVSLSQFSQGISFPAFAILPMSPRALSCSVNRPLCGGAALLGDLMLLVSSGFPFFPPPPSSIRAVL